MNTNMQTYDNVKSSMIFGKYVTDMIMQVHVWKEHETKEERERQRLLCEVIDDYGDQA